MTQPAHQQPAAEPHPDRSTDESAAETSPAPSPEDRAAAETQEAFEAENLIETYQIIGEWIRFADAKAAAVLAVNGVLAGVLIPSLHAYMNSDQPHPTAWWSGLVSVVFCSWLISMIWSCVLSFRCILPFRRHGQHPAIGHADHFHPAAIAEAYRIDQTDQFADEMEKLGMSGLKREIAACMVLDSHISSQKYTNVMHGIRMLALSAILGLLYLLAIQF